MGRFKKGLFFGGLLGAGLMWLATTKKGREVREEMLDHAAAVYVKLKQKILASEVYASMNKNKYAQLVKEYVDKYAVENGLAENVKNLVMKVVSAQWKNMQEELKKKE